MIKKYKVTINKRGRIPGVGNGPFRRPIYISKECYDNLKALGYPVVIIDNSTSKLSKPSFKQEKTISTSIEVKQEEKVIENSTEEKSVEEIIESNEDILESTSDTQVIEENQEEVIDEISDTQVIEENQEEVIDETSEEEILVDDPDLSAEAYYNEEFLTSKSICKKILNRRNVQYENSASYTLLKKLVVDSNPEIN